MKLVSMPLLLAFVSPSLSLAALALTMLSLPLLAVSMCHPLQVAAFVICASSLERIAICHIRSMILPALNIAERCVERSGLKARDGVRRDGPKANNVKSRTLCSEIRLRRCHKIRNYC